MTRYIKHVSYFNIKRQKCQNVACRKEIKINRIKREWFGSVEDSILPRYDEMKQPETHPMLGRCSERGCNMWGLSQWQRPAEPDQTGTVPTSWMCWQKKTGSVKEVHFYPASFTDTDLLIRKSDFFFHVFWLIRGENINRIFRTW